MCLKNIFIEIVTMTVFIVTNNPGVIMAESTEYKSVIKEQFKSINLFKGVDKGDAIVIAQNYVIEKGWDDGYVITNPSIKDSKNKSSGDDEWKVIFNATYSENIKQAKIFGVLGLFRGAIIVNIDKETGEARGFITPFDL